MISLILASEVSADQRFRYPEGKHGKGELRYVHDIPVLTVAGSPEEMGEQYGVLALKPASALKDLVDGFIKQHGWETIYATALKTGNVLLPFFPREHAQELEAASKNSVSWARELLIFSNTVADMQRILQCSTFIVDGQRSGDGWTTFRSQPRLATVWSAGGIDARRDLSADGQTCLRVHHVPGFVGLFVGYQ